MRRSEAGPPPGRSSLASRFGTLEPCAKLGDGREQELNVVPGRHDELRVLTPDDSATLVGDQTSTSRTDGVLHVVRLVAPVPVSRHHRAVDVRATRPRGVSQAAEPAARGELAVDSFTGVRVDEARYQPDVSALPRARSCFLKTRPDVLFALLCQVVVAVVPVARLLLAQGGHALV